METEITTPEMRKAYEEARGLIESGSYDGAIKMLQDLLLVCPGHARAHNDIGVLYSQRGEPKLALEHMTSSLRLDPANTGTMMNVADVCLSVGMNDHAAKMYRLVLAGNPDDGDAAEGLARAMGAASGVAAGAM